MSPVYLPICFAVLILTILIVDSFVSRPKGLKSIRRLLGVADNGVITTKDQLPLGCAWDDKGSWQIGMAVSSSENSDNSLSPPWNWKNDQFNTKTPILSCQDLVSSSKNKNHNLYVSSVSNPVLIPLSDDQWYLFFDYSNVVPRGSFSSRIDIGVSRSTNRGKDWEYLGTVMKDASMPFIQRDRNDSNLFQMIPSIVSGKNKGSIIVYETTMNNFPFQWKFIHKPTLLDQNDKGITSSSTSPSPLFHNKYFNTVAVWHEDRYWIFTNVHDKSTSITSTFHLYHAKDLTSKEPWIKHPMFPKTGGKLAGRPIVYNGNIYRFVQDEQKRTISNGDGGGTVLSVNIFRVNVLSSTTYMEQHIKSIRPNFNYNWATKRIQHIDIFQDTKDWYVFFDGDDKIENQHYWEQHWKFHWIKRYLMIFLIIYVLVRYHRVTPATRYKRFTIKHLSQSLQLEMLKFFHQISEYFNQTSTKTITTHNPNKSSSKCRLLQSIRYFLSQVFIFLLPFILVLTMTDMMERCKESDSFDTEECFDWRNKNYFHMSRDKLENDKEHPTLNYIKRFLADTLEITNAAAAASKVLVEDKKEKGESFQGALKDDDSLIIVTACSSAYFERLKNFVGSVHYWEPNLHVHIYDIGLSDENISEISQWKRVKLIPFDFKKYPSHVSLLYNFAWKIVLFKEVAEQYDKFIYLDSGLELRHPLVGLRYYLERDGYYSTHLEDGRHLIGPTTHPATYGNIKKLGLKFDEDEIKKKPFCAGGIQGFVNGKESSLLKLAVTCALEEECISPKKSGRDHNYDQSVLSVIAYAQGLGRSCNHKDIFADSDESVYTLDETRCNKYEMGARRWRIHRPYIQYIDRYIVKQPEIKREVQPFLVERSQGTLLKVGKRSNWRQCKENCQKKGNRDELESCLRNCKKGRNRTKSDYYLMIAYAKFDHLVTVFRKGLRCTVIQIRVLFVYALMAIILYCFRSARTKKVLTLPMSKNHQN